MNDIPEHPDPEPDGLEFLKAILDSTQVREHPAFVEASSNEDGIDVTVTPEGVDHPVTLTLTIVGAAIIPRRPRRGRPLRPRLT